MFKKNILYIQKKKNTFGLLAIITIGTLLGVWNLNKAGQFWDERGLLELGYRHIQLAKNLDFGHPFWWSGGAEDHPPLVRYVRGLAGLMDLKSVNKEGKPIFHYDLTYDRLVSVILYVLTGVLVFYFGIRYISFFTGFVSSIILLMLPIVLGHAQIAMYEPFNLFFYTASIFSYIFFLEKPRRKIRTLLAGVVLGLAVLSKESNLMLLPMYIGIILVKKNFIRKTNVLELTLRTLCIFVVSFVVFFIFWPMPFFHLLEFMQFQVNLRGGVTTSIPEVFFGKLMLVPEIYYVVHFIITTPLLILLLFLNGLKKIDKSEKWIWYVLVLWFLFPFILSFYWKREQGIRYIIQICAPLALIAGMGFVRFVDFFGKSLRIRTISLVLLIIYLFVILYRITPYYIDYFNILVGGAKGVYEKRLFHLAWWGEGLREAFNYLEKEAEIGSSIGIAVTPSHILPELPNHKAEPYIEGKSYDYVVTNYYHIVRIGFNDSEIIKNYNNIYSVMADGAKIVNVYKKR